MVDQLEANRWGAGDGQVTNRYGLRWLIGYEPDRQARLLAPHSRSGDGRVRQRRARRAAGSCDVIVTPGEWSLASGSPEALDLVVDSGDVDQLAAHHLREFRREVLLESLAVLARGMVLALLGNVQHTTGARTGQRIFQ